MKKMMLYVGMLLLIVLGLLIEMLRKSFIEYSTTAVNPLPPIFFEFLSAIIFMAMVLLLTNFVFRFLMHPVIAVLFILIGFILLALPLYPYITLYIDNSFYERFMVLFNPTSVYIHITGAFLANVGAINIIKHFQSRDKKKK